MLCWFTIFWRVCWRVRAYLSHREPSRSSSIAAVKVSCVLYSPRPPNVFHFFLERQLFYIFRNKYSRKLQSVSCAVFVLFPNIHLEVRRTLFSSFLTCFTKNEMVHEVYIYMYRSWLQVLLERYLWMYVSTAVVRLLWWLQHVLLGSVKRTQRTIFKVTASMKQQIG